MQAVGGHVPFGLLQRANILIHREIKVAALVKIVVLHFLCVEVHIGAVVGRGKSDVGCVGGIQQELGRISHKSPRIQGEMVGIELREAETQLTISRIAIGCETCLARKISVAIHANRVVDGFGGQFGLADIPFQPERIGVGHRIFGSVLKRHQPELVRDGRHRIEIEHETVASECSRLIVKLSHTKETVLGKMHFLVEMSRTVKHRVSV